MTSKTDICNRALIKLGKATIRDIDTDESPQGTLCKAVYVSMLDEVLRQAEWNFAVNRQALNKDASGLPLYEWAYRFILPTVPPVIKIISVENNVPFKIEGNYLVSNSDNIKLKYIGRITDPNLYDSLFINVLVLRLAYEISFSLTSQTSLGDNIYKQYLLALEEAKNQNSQDDNELPIQDSTWTNARLNAISSSPNIIINA
jgi:hypothetical protein